MKIKKVGPWIFCKEQIDLIMDLETYVLYKFKIVSLDLSKRAEAYLVCWLLMYPTEGNRAHIAETLCGSVWANRIGKELNKPHI